MGAWTAEQLPETLFGLFGPALLLLFRYDTAAQDRHFLRRTLLSTFEFAVLIEFLVNVYPLHLAVEIVLVPIFALLGGMIAVAASKQEFHQVRVVLEGLVVLTGFLMLAYTIVSIARSPGSFFTLVNLRDFSAPLLLAVGFLPFLYSFTVLVTYEGLFRRISWLLRHDKSLASYAKRRVFRTARLRLRRVSRLSRAVPRRLTRTSDNAEVDRIIDQARDDMA